MNIGLSVLWFIVAYAIVTWVGIGHTYFNWKVLKIENTKDEINSFYDIDAYAKTVPYHALYNIVLWPVFSYIYFIQVSPEHLLNEALLLGAFWVIITIIIDVIGWVLIKHPWRMTVKEMYIDYQPWITLIYLSIFISPLIATLFI
ncbi:hypothetical protein [Haloplasma contractile]|uniref:Uncharacterized protein n=1 Tax=Haloplasma contractile SSD-17B TaxID=1033810 RepID=F7PRF3_9MOLU|nr:hypothetical protein [Haloplasma contractile]ERJ11721.1 hypothetical protein HLPCO_002204 [Haloplasma contractile SSD-17B]